MHASHAMQHPPSRGPALRRLPALLILGLLALLGPFAAPVPAAEASGCAATPDTFLQAKIDGANTGGTVKVGAGTYTGSLQINKNLTLVGAGEGQTILCGGSPVITIGPAVQVTISGVTITGGTGTSTNFWAGAIHVRSDDYVADAGQLTLDASAVTGNTNNQGYASGIFLDGGGSLTANSSTFSGNTIDPAIDSHSPVTVNNSTFSGNGTGIFVWSGPTSLVVNNSDFNNNAYLGINSGTTALLINNSRLNGNGGGICAGGGGTIIGTAVTNSTGSEDATCSGVFAGGGITLLGNFAVYDSRISGNTGYGLAVIGNQSTTKVVNSTIAENTANSTNGLLGGGIRVGSASGGKLDLIGSTVSGNTVAGGVGAGLTVGPYAIVTVRDTVIAGNTSASSGQAATDCANTGGSGYIESAGYNLIGNDACFYAAGTTEAYNTSLPTDQIGGDGKPVIDAKLGALANNGGATQTMAPLAGSPLLGAGSCTDDQNNPITYDQRLAPRPASGCDIGAFQTGATAPPTGVSLSPDNGTLPDGIPQILWDTGTTVTAGACPGGTATFQLVNQGTVLQSGAMAEGPAGSFHVYIPPLKPNNSEPGKSSPAQVQISVVCPFVPPLTLSMTLDLYIDPSGIIKDVASGQPLAGATATLYRSDSASGPFAAVANGDTTIMSPATATNPQTTGADGGFYWDVADGYYQVRAAKAGCVSAADPTQAYAQSDVLPIPPAVTGIELDLNCATDTTPPATTAALSPQPNAAGWNSGPAAVTLTATDNSGGSGVKQITYSATGAQSIAQTTASGASVTLPTISTAGVTTISYYATDQAGNSEATKTLTVQLDPAAPTCALAGVLKNSVGQTTAIQIAVQDGGSGLASIAITELANATAAVGGYQTGIASAPATVAIADHTTGVVTVQANKLNLTSGASIALTATDVAGNSVSCDPVSVAAVRADGKPVTQPVAGVTQADHTLTVINDSAAVDSLSVVVNGRTFKVASLKAGGRATVDISAALTAGSNCSKRDARRQARQQRRDLVRRHLATSRRGRVLRAGGAAPSLGQRTRKEPISDHAQALHQAPPRPDGRADATHALQLLANCGEERTRDSQFRRPGSARVAAVAVLHR